ncbi:MAG TPA: PfkB family carbohydrate kinase [Candidatus Methylomirabilis sp.]|nr:PfkB family carbohydrate kinase [Candidatus Methylomirabilis sp.]
MTYDIAYVGHYTKDIIVYPQLTRTVDGGAFYYGANVAVRMGLRTAVVTRLAREDWHVVEELERLGVTVFARATPASTLLRLTYPTANLDERTIELLNSAGPFTVDEVADVQARAFAIGASVRGEVPTAVVEALAEKGAIVALDVQGWIRVVRDGTLTFDDWPGKEDVLKHVTVLKTDSVEATHLTGESDRDAAARRLAALGPREVLLTHGGGVLVHADGSLHEAPFVPQEVRGRSGRGDTCTSAYLSRRLTASPAEAVRWAAAVTSLKLEAEGPFRRDLAEVEALYRRLAGQ